MLHRRERLTAPDTVHRLLAVQAQDLRAARLALRPRAGGATAADVDAALDSAELVISWLCRGTLHMVHRDDYAWIHSLTAPPLVTMNRTRLRQEGVTKPERAVEILLKALAADGPQLRGELAARLTAAGIATNGQAMVHILLKATLAGDVVRGPLRGREQTFVLTRDWLGELPPVARDKALTELGRRYLAAHAPSDAADLARWAGIRLGDAKAALRDAGDAKAELRDAGDAPPRTARIPPRLLGPFDPYIMGWKDRSFAVPQEHEKTLLPGGGMFRAVAIDDGVVVGDWQAVDADPRFERERADVARFLGSEKQQ